jgi:hypothetical protein
MNRNKKKLMLSAPVPERNFLFPWFGWHSVSPSHASTCVFWEIFSFNGSLGLFECEVDIACRCTAGACSTHAPCGTDGASRSNTLLPATLGDVDRGALGDRLERELGASRLADCALGCATTLCDGASDTSTDAQLGDILVVEDNVAGWNF